MNKDMELFEEIERLIDSTDNEIQRALSLSKLNISVKESFEGVMENLESIHSLALRISDNFLSVVVASKVSELISHIEQKREQLN